VKVLFKHKLFLLLLCFIHNHIFSQLTVTPGGGATQLVQSLVGPGVTVSNVTLNCPSNAYGTFSNGGSTNLGLTSGILLTSGSASIAAGANNSGSAGACNNAPGDAQLNSLASASTYDRCVLEFDIVPVCDTIKFFYVFGSDEYPEWVNSGFNDAFAFFISGPGITGQKNIALVPGTNTAVTINSINANTNSQYYVNNVGGATIQYDGFTKKLTAQILVQACQTYHIKLAIADGGDCIYDSGVFLEQGSLSCYAVTASVTGQNAVEGCMNGQVQFCRGGSTTLPHNINYTIGGTATNGVDYTLLSGVFTIPAGQACGTLNVVPIDDGIPEPVEDVILYYTPSNCAALDSAVILIGDKIVIDAGPNVGFCSGDSTKIGLPNAPQYANYSWSPTTGIYNPSNPNPYVALTNTGSANITTQYMLTQTIGVCTAKDSVNVTVYPSPQANPVVTNVSCKGANNGSAVLNVTGSGTPFSYTWSPNVSNSGSASNLSPGNYSVTVMNVNNCKSIQTFTISEPPLLTSTASQTNVTCPGGNNGSASVTANGGTPVYAYLWSNSAVTATINNISAGNYSVTVTDSKGCTTTQSYTITEPSVFTATLNVSNVNCNGGSNGSISVTVNGGNSPYSYTWNPNVGNGATVTGLTAGSYYVTITDNNGCSISKSADVTEPTPLVLTPSQFNVKCFGNATGKASVFVSGGVTPYSYTWSPSISTADSAINLTAGNYDITVTDANSCTINYTFNITEPTKLTSALSSVDATCFAACNGNAIASPSGGISPYTYLWCTGKTTQNAINLCAGTCGVTVTDQNGCTFDTSLVINEPPGFSGISTSMVNSNCGKPDGSATVTNVSGATPPYNYLWQNAQTNSTATGLTNGNFCVTISDNNNCDTVVCVLVGYNPPPTASVTGTNALCKDSCNGTATASAIGGTTPGTYSYLWNFGDSAQTVSGLCAGNYSVIVNDGNNCSDTAYVTIVEPTYVVVSLPADTTICVSGTVSMKASASGGTSPYTYQWSNSAWSGAGTHSDNPNVNTCYSVTATDKNGCISNVPVSCVTILPPVSAFAYNDTTICTGGAASLFANATGGDGTPYTYSWSSGQSTPFITVSPQGAYPNTVTYYVVASDNCSPADTAYVYVEFYPDPVVTLSANTEGCEPFSTVFQNTTANSSICNWSLPGSGTPIISNCDTFTVIYPFAGSYDVSLIVTDQNGCKGTVFYPGYITVNPLPDADFVFSPQPTDIQNMLINFTDISGGNITSWNWNFFGNQNPPILLGNSNTQNPQFDFSVNADTSAQYVYYLSDTGYYPVSLIITTDKGCMDSITKLVKIDPAFYINVPNAFTPNGDGVNDYFFPVGVGIVPDKNYNLYIFDRWGDIIFESHRIDDPWDGTAREQRGTTRVKQDVYIWKLEVEDILFHQIHKLSGTVTVIY
jgi:gliding motility-associated-like protein